jgi:hypothetical protein
VALGVLTYYLMRLGADSQLKGPSPWPFFSLLDLMLLGAMPLLAVVVSTFCRRTVEPGLPEPLARTWPVMTGFLSLFLFSVLFSFGPQIQGFSGSIRNLFYEVLYSYGPGINGMRVPQRVWIVGSVATAMLCGLAVWVLTRGLPRGGRWIVGVGFVGVFLAEHFCAPLNYNMAGRPPGSPYVPLSGHIEIGTKRNKLYDWIQANPQIDAVVELPNPDFYYDLRYVYNITQHGKRLLNGSSGGSPIGYEHLRRALRQFPDENSLMALRFMRVGYVIFHGDMLEAKALEEVNRRVAIHAGEVRLVHSHGASRVYQLVPRPDDGAAGP